MGRNDTGILQAGKAADLVLMNLEDVVFAGCHDPLVSMVCCGNTSIVDTTIVTGRIVVCEGRLITLDPEDIRVKSHKVSTEMVEERSSKSKY